MSYRDYYGHLYQYQNGYIEHHGIKGQKWGVRRYQNYDGTRIKTTANCKTYSSSIVRETKDNTSLTSINPVIDKMIKNGEAYIDNLKSYNVGWLVYTNPSAPGQKINSAMTNGHDVDWHEESSVLINDHGTDTIYTGNPAGFINTFGSDMFRDSKSEAEHIATGQISDDDLYSCNPMYGSPGTVQNCAKCSATLELKMRGFDTFSAGRQTYPSTTDAPSLWFNDAHQIDFDSSNAQEGLESYGPNTSGTISIQYPNGMGGHMMHWTNDTDGHFEIQDGQAGTRYSSVEDMMSTLGADASAGVSTYRLDNCSPNWDNLSSDSVVRWASVKSPAINSFVKNRFTDKIADTW